MPTKASFERLNVVKRLNYMVFLRSKLGDWYRAAPEWYSSPVHPPRGTTMNRSGRRRSRPAHKKWMA